MTAQGTIRTSTAQTYKDWPEGTFKAELVKVTAGVDKNGKPQYRLQWRMLEPVSIAADASLGALFDRVQITFSQGAHGPEPHFTIRRLRGFLTADPIFLDIDPNHPDFTTGRVYDAALNISLEEALAQAFVEEDNGQNAYDLNELMPLLVGREAVVTVKYSYTDDKQQKDEKTGMPVQRRWVNVAEYRLASTWAAPVPDEIAQPVISPEALVTVVTPPLESFA